MSTPLISGYDSETSKDSSSSKELGTNEQEVLQSNKPEETEAIPPTNKLHENLPSPTSEHKKEKSTTIKKKKKKKKKFKRGLLLDGANDVPPELAEELFRSGHNISDVNFVEINAVEQAALPVTETEQKKSKHAILAAATRITKGKGVSRVERQKHQITALAADAAALQAAKKSVEGSMGNASKRNNAIKGKGLK